MSGAAIISEGAEAKIYMQSIFDANAIAKVREPKKYRQAALDEEIRSSRTRSEAKIMAIANSFGIRSPSLLAVGKYTIIMSKISGERMSSLKKPSMRIFYKLGMLLAKLHDVGIAHGDFTPANIIISKGLPYVIDFGLAEITGSIEEKAIDLLLMKRSIGARQYAAMERAYAAAYTPAKAVIKRLAAIERRGRYQTRTMQAAEESD